ncbi:ABC transporter substrate-binding protein [Bacillus sp. FJAT-47783]|uniref:ABC transporter substrate-binding protein n=1 Tax=Bacillus sp. FJAT-47783 TaxID=2922712 RepID=UPI001FABF965|nr:ABC transporter substrate-binding protein [Bacillus sp. FJAT-47783]
MNKLLFILLVSVLFLSACTAGEKQEGKDYSNATWEEIVSDAKGSTVRMFMWGGDEGINRYMDEVIATTLKEKYDITFERVPMDTKDILQKLLTEKKAGKEEGTMDIIWVNGENFKNAKMNDLLYGPFTSKLPNFNEFVNEKSLHIQYDFGTKTEGYEAPWGKVQFVFLYDEKKVPTPPTSFAELLEWAKQNPGKFTYPEADDFTGNAFLRHVLYNTVGVESLLEHGFNEEYVHKQAGDMWSYLNELKPFLWREGETYPKDLTELDRLYSRGEVWMTMGYNEARAESLVQEGVFPKTTKSFIFESGSIGNTHFLAIPYNRPNVAGAMVAINEMLSPEAQLAKYERAYWGESFALDLNKLHEDTRAQFEAVDRGASVLDAETLKKYMLPEVDANYVNWIKETWYEKVVHEK